MYNILIKIDKQVILLSGDTLYSLCKNLNNLVTGRNHLEYKIVAYFTVD